MSIEAPHSEETKHTERYLSWRQQIAIGLAGTALFGVVVNGLANEISRADDPHNGPTVELVHIPALAPDIAPTKAEMGEKTPDYIEEARNSKFVLVIFSGTGMETSHHTGRELYKTVHALGGTIIYCWYGSHYDPTALAGLLRDRVAQITRPGEVKPVIGLGQSFGGIAETDVSLEPAIENATFMKFVKFIEIESPVDLSDATETVFGVPVSWLKDVEIPEFNDLTTLANAINGQFLREELNLPEEWNNTFINAAKTSPQLMESQVRRMQQGLKEPNPNVSIDYIGSTDSKNTVNHRQAYARLDAMTDAPTRYISISGVDHDEIWLSKQVDKYIPAIIDSIKGVTGKEA